MALVAPMAFARTEPKVDVFYSAITKRLLLMTANGFEPDAIWVNAGGWLRLCKEDHTVKIETPHLVIYRDDAHILGIPIHISCAGWDETKPWFCVRHKNFLWGGGPGVWSKGYEEHSKLRRDALLEIIRATKEYQKRYSIYS